MAEIMTPQKNGRRKIHNTRVDLTPMVDLGFLLITFFMFTTTLAKPKVVSMTVPDNSTTARSTVYPMSSTITLMPAGNHTCYYYEGILGNAGQVHKVNISHLRDIMSAKKTSLRSLSSPIARELHVIIKPGNSAMYQDLIQVLDDIMILDVQYYSITDITTEEKDIIAKL